MASASGKVDKPPWTSEGLAKALSIEAQNLRLVIINLLNQQDIHFFQSLFRQFEEELGPMSLEQFADAFAQTLVCGLLATRWMTQLDGIDDFRLETIHLFLSNFANDVKKKFATILACCAQIPEQVEALLNKLRTVNLQQVFSGADPVIHFYEPFLHEYDKSTRKHRGVYYTPPEVVNHMVMVVHHQLQTKFGLPLGLADESSWQQLFDNGTVSEIPMGYANKPFVQILDPAMGTGTYVKKVVEVIRETMQKHWQQNSPNENHQALWTDYVTKTNGLLQRLYGFEVLMAPLVIAQLRLGFLLSHHDTMPVDKDNHCFQLYLTNTLHNKSASASIDKVKNRAAVTVIIGNPPYKRETKKTAHPDNWVRENLLTPYRQGSSQKGYGVHLKNIYNAYIYFWRFAEWKIHTHSKYGIVSFITASSFLQGPGFHGLREHFRKIGSHLYIIDLEGNQRGFRITENVFHIQTAVAIGTLVIHPDQDFHGKYHRVEGTAEQKKAFCLSHTTLEKVPFLDISKTETFVGHKESLYHSFPYLVDIFPAQHCGIQFKRTWPIGPTKDVLKERIQRIVRTESEQEKKRLFQENDRTIDKSELNIFTNVRERPFKDETHHGLCNNIQKYGYRAFDRAWCLADNRVCSRPRKKLWRGHSNKQIYFVGILRKTNFCGPALIACANIPDLDFVRASGKDIVPMYTNAEANQVNISPAIYQKLCATYQTEITPESVFYYLYAMLGGPQYTIHYQKELQVPGPKIPITKQFEIFRRGTKLGKELICIHTFGERLAHPEFKLEGNAYCLESLPRQQDAYPERFTYTPETETIWACRGNKRKAFVTKVSPATWNFSISGFKPVQSWLKYRTKGGKVSSPLDRIRPTS